MTDREMSAKGHGGNRPDGVDHKHGMSGAPVISLLMANYNNGRYLPEAVASLHRQSFGEWELVIVDDASTDDSWDIISRIAESDSRIRIFRNGTNLKVGATKRKAVSLAAGEICGILDPDDALTENALEAMVRAHEECPGCALISSTHWICDEFLNKKSLPAAPQAIPEGRSYLESDPGSVHSFWTFKKSFYDRTDGFSERYPIAEDQDLFYKLEEVGRLGYVPEPLYLYRMHEGGISTGDKVAIAFSWHIEVMLAALRRRRHLAGRFDLCNERKVVADHILNFLGWGITRIDSRRMARHLTALLRLEPKALFHENVLRVIRWMLKSRFFPPKSRT